MPSSPDPQRRSFLAAVGAASLLATTLPSAEADAEAQTGAGATPSLVSDPPRPLERTGADLGTNYSAVAAIADSWQASVFPPAGPDSFDEAFRVRVRQLVQAELSYQPPVVELRPEIVEEVDCGDHVRQRVLISTAPWFRVAGYVLVPRGRRGRGPAIVDLHSHGGMFLFGKEKVIDLGNNHPAMTRYHEQNYAGRPTATALVRRGYVVMSIDAFMFGERRVLLDEDQKYGWDRARYSLDDVQHLNTKCRAKEATIAKSLVLAGATWPGIVNHDDRRVVEYLSTRSDVDPNRIGCVGISLGGYRSAYLAAMEPRIRAACVVGFMSSMRPMLQAHVDTHSWLHFLPGLHRLLDLPEVAALAAPRALFVQQCSQDRLFPLAGMQSSVQRLAELYRAAGQPEKFRGEFYDEPHRWTVAMQDQAFDWLDQQLR